VARLLRGEPLELVARETNVSIAKLSEWRDRALAGAATWLPFKAGPLVSTIRPGNSTARKADAETASGPSASNVRTARQATSQWASLGLPSHRVDNHPTS
jgi:hypothetical protein